MKKNLRKVLGLGLVLGLGTMGFAQSVFINELHYDNTGTDTGEGAEVAGPAGTDLTGWSLVPYNGNGGGLYSSTALSGTIPDEGSGYGAIWFNIGGLQNGSPDGIVLVDASGTNVVHLLSYEGSFAAADGPANGQTLPDMGVSESGSDPVGYTLQLTGTGTTLGDFAWQAPSAGSPGTINSGQTFGTPVIKAVVGDDPGIGNWTPSAAADMVQVGDFYTTTVTLAGTGGGEFKVLLDKAAEWGGGDVLGNNARSYTAINPYSGPVTFNADLSDTSGDGWIPGTASVSCSLYESVPFIVVGAVQSEFGGSDWNPDDLTTLMHDDGLNGDAVASDNIFTFSGIPSGPLTAADEWKIVSVVDGGNAWTDEYQFGNDGATLSPPNIAGVTASTVDTVTFELDLTSGRVRATVVAGTVDPVLDTAFTTGTLDTEIYASFGALATSGGETTPSNWSFDDASGAAVSSVNDLGGGAYLLTMDTAMSGDLTSDTLTFDNGAEAATSANLYGGIVGLDTLRAAVMADPDYSALNLGLDGALITVDGWVIENLLDDYGDDNITIQNGAFGIVCRDYSAFDLPAAVTMGNEILFVGEVDEYNGLLQIATGSVGLIADLGATRRAVPPANVLDAGTALGADYEAAESTMTVLSGLTFDDTGLFTVSGGGSNWTVNGGITLLAVRLDGDVSGEFDGQAIPGGPGTITGIIGQYDNGAPRTSGYQTFPLTYSALNFPFAGVDDWMILND